MTKYLTILFCVISITLTSAQDQPHVHSRNYLSALLDSVKASLNSKRISAAQQFDSLDLPAKMDAGRLAAPNGLDSTVSVTCNKLDTMLRVHPATRVPLKADSVPPLRLPDSLTRRVSSLGLVKSQLDAKITNIDGAPLRPTSLNDMGGIQHTDSQEPISLPNVDRMAEEAVSVPQVTVPKLKSLNPAALDVPKELIPDIHLPRVPDMEQLSEVQSGANELGKNLGDYESVINRLPNANLPDLEQLPEKLQEEALKIDEIGAAKSEVDRAGELTQVIDEARSPDAIKEKAKEYVKKQAVDHFAGKEEALKNAMEKVSKLKAKYGEFSSMKNLPKRKPNPMKDKPFVERILPGITLQVQKSENVLIDLNPLVGYKMSGRLTAGFGWNERLAFGKSLSVSGRERIFGPRAYTSFWIGRGYLIKAEAEMMNTYVPPSVFTPARVDFEGREWIWSLFVGLKKDYQFFKNVRGNFQILYNVYDEKDASPYADRLNMRLGFEFPLKKKAKD